MTEPVGKIGQQQRALIPIGQHGPLFSFHPEPDQVGTLVRVCCDQPGFLFEITWGTSSTRTLVNIEAPFSADMPGMIEVTAHNLSAEEGRASVSAAWVKARGRCMLREFIDATAAPVTVQTGAARIFAVPGAAVTYTQPDGTPATIVNDPATAGRPFPIQSGSIISAGKAYVEYEA